MNPADMATVSVAVVRLVQLLKRLHLPSRFAPLAVFGTAAAGVALKTWAPSYFDLVAIWVVVSVAAEGAYHATRRPPD